MLQSPEIPELVSKKKKKKITIDEYGLPSSMVKTKHVCMWMQTVNILKVLITLIIWDHRHQTKEAVPKKPRHH